jgi:GTPase SAR1 family protein
MVPSHPLRDTAGQEEYARLRPLAYPNTDIFLITFSVVEKSTFINAIKRVTPHHMQWYEEVHRTVPGALIVFVGNKTDLRSTQAGKNSSLS